MSKNNPSPSFPPLPRTVKYHLRYYPLTPSYPPGGQGVGGTRYILGWGGAAWPLIP